MNQPFVSLIIPCRNEEKYIALCLDSLIENDYPKEHLEILIIDGLSKDSTKIIVAEYAARFDFIKLLQNPAKIFPSAVNIGVKTSKGKLVFIIGAHAQYEKDYISECVFYSLKLDADNIGGVLKTVSRNDTFAGEIITSVLSSRFGVGNSTFRTGSDRIMEVDTVFGGCYKRNIFDKIGYLNENLISTSDYEFNKRLRRSGGKIFLVPAINVKYFTRSTFKKFIINNFRNGFWAIYPIAFVNYVPVSLRHLVPLIYFISLISTFILSFFFQVFGYLLIGILVAYTLAAIYFSAKTLKFSIAFFMPFFFFILHLSYGIGSFLAVIKVLIVKMCN